MTNGQKSALKEVLWHPYTWVPLAVASLVVAFLPLWAGAVAFIGALITIGAIWGGQISRLSNMIDVLDQKDKSQAEQNAQQDYLQNLRRGCPPAADAFAKAQQITNEIVQIVRANNWLEQFDYTKNAFALLDGLKAEGNDIIASHSISQRDQWKSHENNFAAAIEALLDTQKTIKQNLADSANSGAAGDTQSLAQTIMKRNRLNSKNFSGLSKSAPVGSDDAEKQSQ